MNQERQERGKVDAAVVPVVPQRRCPAPTLCSGLQSRQFHVNAGPAEGGEALVANDAAGKAGQDRCEGGQPRTLRYLPNGGGGGCEGPVPQNPSADRRAAAKAKPGVSWGLRKTDRRSVSGRGENGRNRRR